MLEQYEAFFPFWEQLEAEQRRQLSERATVKNVKKGTVLHSGKSDCVGLMLVAEGQLRVYTVSEEGREITLYRLLQRDMCLLSASCMLHSIQFDVTVEAEQDSTVLNIPADLYRKLMSESLAVSNYTNELMASKFSDVMWLMDQILNKRLDSRLAAFLLEESDAVGADKLTLTHEIIARHLGSAREVITRMLKYFQKEGMVELSRGSVRLTDRERLEETAGDSLR
ncbi:Crp/Fnr family transcriptional regulator [Bacilliculturomica massiliensis]|uniref:Crp/Fnr family transcriptional regulator n=1 Tax=Bacilliculturomica massiliensis TaxID=1917867 RepID=UPI0010308AE9|nr:Crp/Fnr family transcriptional regulator [Bacilliculturomica massiliensis]